MSSMKRWIWLPAVLLLAVGCDSGPTDPALGSLHDDDIGALAAEQGMLEEQALDQNRSMTPEQFAQRWINHAANLFDRAERMAGPNPEPPISAWLQTAQHLLGQARGAFDQGNYHVAVIHAQNSAAKSWQVIEALTPAPDISELAERAIDRAGRLLARATELADQGDPSPEILDMLARARTLLDDAKHAFASGDYREAIRLARESAALSSQVIRSLTTTTITR
jgi:hypothetical protein